MASIPATMTAAVLPGNSTVEITRRPVPRPGHGEVLLLVKSSTICGSDIRAIYRKHTGTGPEGYRPGTIAGHEPCGRIVATGPGCRRFKDGDRVVVYHISGCGLCNDCRRGSMISCTSETYRRAYGWQRDGGMAEYLLAEEKDLVGLPGTLSFSDGAQVACGFGTAYEGLEKIGIGGDDAVLITGLGPVGLASAMLARAMGAQRIIGADVVPERLALARQLQLCDEVLESGSQTVDQVRERTGGLGVEKSIDCSGSDQARRTCVRATRKWGRISFVGEGGTVTLQPSADIIHDQKTIFGSWVTSIWRMEELLERIVRWGIHPDALITNRFPLAEAGDAYALMDGGKCGKVAVVFDEEAP